MSNKNSNPFKNEEIKETEEQDTVKDSNPKDLQDSETSEEITSETDSEINTIKEDYEKLNQQYIRLAADFDNFRKRQEQERENLITFGKETILKAMLEVLDNFERGEKSLENVEDCTKVKDSFTLIHRQVCEALNKLGLEEIKAIGEEFDPNFHEAVMQTPTSEHKENTVITELQKGYKFGEKVLRATLVNVATAE